MGEKDLENKINDRVPGLNLSQRQILARMIEQADVEARREEVKQWRKIVVKQKENIEIWKKTVRTLSKALADLL